MSDANDPAEKKDTPEKEAAKQPKSDETGATTPKPRTAAPKPQFKVTQSPFAPSIGAAKKAAQPRPGFKGSAPAPARPKPAGKEDATAEPPAKPQGEDAPASKPKLDQPSSPTRPPARRKTAPQTPGAIEALERQSKGLQPGAVIGLVVDVAAAVVAVGFAVMLAMNLLPYL